MEAIRVFYDPSDLSRVYDSKGNLIKKGYTKFFKKARRIFRAKKAEK